MPTLQECIDLFHERERTRPPGTPIRIYRGATMTPSTLRFTLAPRGGRGRLASGTERRRIQELADLGDQTGLLVGVVADERKVEASA